VTDFKEIDLCNARESVLIGGLPFEVTDLDTAARDVVTIAAGSPDQGLVVRLSNASGVTRASRDHDYRELFAKPGVTLPDGAPVAWAMRVRARFPRTGAPVRGPSLVVEVLDRGRDNDLRHFMIGSSDETLTKFVDDATIRYPGVNIAGAYALPSGAAKNGVNNPMNRDCIERIAEAKPDVVWIGLDSPKREFAAAALADRLPGVFVDLGFDLESVAASVRPVPTWIDHSGFSWAYRLFVTVKPIRRRSLLANARFVLAVLRGK
jgi:N-acetylglucosaminyldiphosphoundecaprenol N-acetyl-beta-D-mannosaminyltransferase